MGLGKIYTEEEIAKAKESPSFEREYNLKYLGLIGNVFHTKDIDAAIDKGDLSCHYESIYLLLLTGNIVMQQSRFHLLQLGYINSSIT